MDRSIGPLYSIHASVSHEHESCASFFLVSHTSRSPAPQTPPRSDGVVLRPCVSLIRARAQGQERERAPDPDAPLGFLSSCCLPSTSSLALHLHHILFSPPPFVLHRRHSHHHQMPIIPSPSPVPLLCWLLLRHNWQVSQNHETCAASRRRLSPSSFSHPLSGGARRGARRGCAP